nr:MAG TPA: hypothetical protein [Caudoviricetes sp.]
MNTLNTSTKLHFNLFGFLSICGFGLGLSLIVGSISLITPSNHLIFR